MKKFKILMAILVLVFGTLVFLPEEKTAYAENIDRIDATWLVRTTIDEDSTNVEPYQSKVTVGRSWGYGKFMLGEEDIVLGTEAQDGYQLVGWQIVYNDREDIVSFISKDTEADANTTRTNNADGGLVITRTEGLVTYTLSFSDIAQDGYFEAGSFTISDVAENLTVSAVYDHIYYKVDVTDFSQVVDIAGMTRTVCGGQTILNMGGAEEGVYKDAYYLDGEQIYFVGDVYAGNDCFYTVHNTLDENPKEEHIDISRGAFRLGDEVGAEVKVAFDEENLETDSVNIVVNSISLDGEEIEDAIITAHEDYKNTTNLVANFTIIREAGESEDDISVLTLDYTNLYLAKLNAKIDGQAIDNTHEHYNLIMNSATVHNSLLDSVLGNDSFFVPEGAEIRVTAGLTITRTIGGGTYTYYTFKSIDGGSSAEKVYSAATGDIDIELGYESIEYEIEFKFAVLSNGVCTELQGDYNLENAFTMKRGDETVNFTRTLVEGSDSEYISDNVGYEFYGFTFDKFNVGNNDNIDIVIDNEKPRGYTIYMVYTEIDYILDIVGFDSITLSNNDSTIYPISSALLNFGGNTYTISEDSLRNATSKE